MCPLKNLGHELGFFWWAGLVLMLRNWQGRVWYSRAAVLEWGFSLDVLAVSGSRTGLLHKGLGSNGSSRNADTSLRLRGAPVAPVTSLQIWSILGWKQFSIIFHRKKQMRSYKNKQLNGNWSHFYLNKCKCIKSGVFKEHFFPLFYFSSKAFTICLIS